jgi:hypothetical protein
MLHVKYLLDAQRWGVFLDEAWPVYPPVAVFDAYDAALVFARGNT